ncbi:DUF4276 family protein [Thiolapillus sp.]|uniref:DUF4276 family protein n=1 Tax=Thiolapillus sp. TaxID=2017437 RepID=UPI0025FFFC88|nr:DUF4276 family protein [Thiolapillus sp.]
MTAIYVATEDALSEAVLDRIFQFFDVDIEVITWMRKNGIGYLQSKFPELVRLAGSVPVLMLVDLDRKECAPALLRDWLQNVALPDGLLFRVAVREVEAWLLADHEAFAEFARTPARQLPDKPDELEDPKQFLLNLVRRYARRPTKDALLPRKGAVSKVGVGYNTELIRFVKEIWRPDRAAEYSDSLARMIPRVQAL